MYKHNQLYTNIVDEGEGGLWKNLLDNAQVKHVRAKEIIFYEQTPGNHLYYLVSGKLEVFLSSEDGKRLIINNLSDGCIFGEIGLILDNPRSASVRAVKPSVLKIISKRVFFDELKNNYPLNLYLLNMFAKYITTLSNNLRSMALEDVYYRTILLLQNLSNSDLAPGTVINKTTHNNIALHVGSSREMISKIFKELTAGEYIKVTGDKIEILKQLPKKY